MRLRDYLGLTMALASGALILGACAHERGPPPPPPPPPPPLVGTVHGDAPGVVLPAAPKAEAPQRGKRVKGAMIDPACRYCVTDDPKKRQYFDQRRNRYYYFDRSKKAYFWENGEPKI